MQLKIFENKQQIKYLTHSVFSILLKNYMHFLTSMSTMVCSKKLNIKQCFDLGGQFPVPALLGYAFRDCSKKNPKKRSRVIFIVIIKSSKRLFRNETIDSHTSAVIVQEYTHKGNSTISMDVYQDIQGSAFTIKCRMALE